jgi:histone H3/H4
MVKTKISLSALHRICLKTGAERVSEAAVKELAVTLEQIGIKIAKDALEYAIHAGRVTIKAEDIELATKKIVENK